MRDWGLRCMSSGLNSTRKLKGTLLKTLAAGPKIIFLSTLISQSPLSRPKYTSCCRISCHVITLVQWTEYQISRFHITTLWALLFLRTLKRGRTKETKNNKNRIKKTEDLVSSKIKDWIIHRKAVRKEQNRDMNQLINILTRFQMNLKILAKLVLHFYKNKYYLHEYLFAQESVENFTHQ